MSEKKKGIGDALISLFVVREGGEEGAPVPEPGAEPAAQATSPGGATGDPAVDDLIARYASGSSGPSGKRGRSRPPSPPPPPAAATAAPASAAAAPSAPVAEVPAAQVPDVAVDFPTVLRKGGLTDEEQGRVDKAFNLLHNLPAETPIEIKRQIVAASLQAFGIPVDQILEAALLHVAAYERHVRAGESETQSLLEQSNKRLAELEQEALRIRKIMSETQAHQQGLAFACSRQKMRIQEVLDFFGPDAVERARQSSVKLRNRQD